MTGDASNSPEFITTGMTWLGAFDVAEMTDAEVDQFADALVEWQDQMSAQHRRDVQAEPPPDGPGIPDPRQRDR